MKKLVLFVAMMLALHVAVEAQCSICTKTAAQLGEKPARGLNTGIIYLAFTPLAIVGFVAWRWFNHKGDDGDVQPLA